MSEVEIIIAYLIERGGNYCGSRWGREDSRYDTV